MKYTTSAGGVVLNSKRQVLVVSQGGTSWSLPKGKLEEGEDFLTAAKREIEEETGVTELELVKELGSYQRSRIHDPEEIKTIHLFLFKTTQEDLSPKDPDNPEARWVDRYEVEGYLTSEKDKEFFKGVIPGI